MGQGCPGGTSEADKKNAAIEKYLRGAKEQMRDEVKLLLLGKDDIVDYLVVLINSCFHYYIREDASLLLNKNHY